MGGLHQRPYCRCTTSGPAGRNGRGNLRLELRRLTHAGPLAPAAAEVEWNVHAAPKSCSWIAARRCGSSKGMDEETRERIIIACTKVAMMMEELSVQALGAAEQGPEELSRLVRELRITALAILDLLEVSYIER